MFGATSQTPQNAKEFRNVRDAFMLKLQEYVKHMIEFWRGKLESQLNIIEHLCPNLVYDFNKSLIQ